MKRFIIGLLVTVFMLLAFPVYSSENTGDELCYSTGAYVYFDVRENLKLTPQQYTGEGIKVAIIDSGIGEHYLLPEVIWKDFVDGKDLPYDDNGHGTFIAGIIHKNAPGAELYIARAIADKTGKTADIVAAINWAIENQVDIINFSIVSRQTNMEIINATRKASNAGIIVVASTGHGIYKDGRWTYIGTDIVAQPARDFSTLAVGAVDSTGKRASYSNYGAGLDLTAPGETISTEPGYHYKKRFGTSFAVPFVVAKLACLKEQYPDFANNQLIETLYAELYATGNAYEYGNGILQPIYR